MKDISDILDNIKISKVEVEKDPPRMTLDDLGKIQGTDQLTKEQIEEKGQIERERINAILNEQSDAIQDALRRAYEKSW